MQLVLPETAEALIGFRPDPELQERIDELAGKSTEGQLTEAEKSEYAGYVGRISSLPFCSGKRGD